MRIATFTSEGHRKVGLVSADGTTVTPLKLTQAQADVLLLQVGRVVAGAQKGYL